MNASVPPLVSVVTPTWNRAQYLDQTIQSVLGQDYPHIEFIVIDDGSDDGGATVELLGRYAQIRWWSRPNRGQYATLNEGFAAARGDFVTTLGADDWYVDRRVVSSIMAEASSYPRCDVVFGLSLFVDARGSPLPFQRYEGFPVWMLRYATFVSHGAVFVRRQKLIADRIRFDETLRHVGDADWLAQLYVAGYRFQRVNRIVQAIRHHPGQMSSRSVRGGPDHAMKAVELQLLQRRYAPNPVLRRAAAAYVTFHRRRRVAVAAWQEAGLKGLWRAVWNWILRIGWGPSA